ncbi:MAG: hypothetical protein AB1384_07940 [Actinomycetota bacterium]
MRKVVVILMVVLVCAGGVALAAWRITDDEGDESTAVSGGEGTSFQSELEETTSAQEDAAGSGDTTSADSGDPNVDDAAADTQSGEDFSYTTPDQRYVTETQRHQDFLRAVAEGRVTRMEVTSTNIRPAGEPDTSYVYFTITSDTGTSQCTFVMKFYNGMWRIAAINQLSGNLGGGTNYMVPDSFEEDLGREIAELQPFLTKVAEGRFAYMEVHAVDRPNDSESILTGAVVGKNGVTVPAEMYLHKDYGIWHITYITNPPG